MTITRDEAIARMAKGEKCETRGWDNGCIEFWSPTDWPDFKNETNVFRIPPQREAREFYVNPINCIAYDSPDSTRIHVREVLPDERVVRVMTEAKWVQRFADWTNHQDHKCQWPRDGWLAFARALGLIVENGS